jgi:hypothetical protein
MSRASFVSLHLARFDALRVSEDPVCGDWPGVLFCQVGADSRAAGTEPSSREAFVFVALGLHADSDSVERVGCAILGPMIAAGRSLTRCVWRLRLHRDSIAEWWGMGMTLGQRASRAGVAVVLALFVALVAATASAPFAAGTLNLRGTVRVRSEPVACPPDAPPLTECRARTGTGRIQGLGSVSVTYLWSFGPESPSCPSTQAKPLATTGRIVVGGKGEFRFALAQGAKCVEQTPQEPVGNEPQSFTIIGGTGIYEAASGSGTVERALSPGAGSGPETWTGTLVASAVEFDVTPPTLSGATPRTVRAPKGARSVRVRYKVTASDNAESQIPVTCTPRSGSRFPIGRTVVTCSATDSSANTANGSFRVTVKRTR